MPRKNFRSLQKNTRVKDYPLRTGQLMGPYSIGSILPCDANTTLMIAGLEAFDTNKMIRIHDSRLERYIGVDKLYAPPVDDGPGTGYTAHVADACAM